MIKAILLAAGQSKRLKSENKLIKKFKNKALINHSLQALFKSKVDKIVIVLGYQNNEVRKVINKNKKNIFVLNKKFRLGMSSSINTGLKKISKKDKGFIIVQSDMPFIKTSDINKIYNSISKKRYLVHALKFKNKIGNPIGFDSSVLTNNQLTMSVKNKKLILGTWQGLYLFEHKLNGQKRTISCHLMGD